MSNFWVWSWWSDDVNSFFLIYLSFVNHMRVGLLPSKKICGRSVDHGGPPNQPDSPDMQLDLTSIERCKNPWLPVDACGTGGAGQKKTCGTGLPFHTKNTRRFLCQNSPKNQRRESDAEGHQRWTCGTGLLSFPREGTRLNPNIWKVQSFWSRIRLFNAMVVSFKIAVLQGLGLL